MPYVTDTHSLIWHMTEDSRLSPEARRVFQEADNVQERVFIPCIVFFELLYLTEKKRIPVDLGTFLAIISSSTNYRVEPLCLPIIEKARGIPRDRVSDPWDRLIAATSMHLKLPLITRDEKLRNIGLDIVW